MKQKKLVIYIIALTMTVILSVGILFAWFAINRYTNTSFILSIMSEPDDLYENIIKITRITDEVTLAETDDTEAYLMPGKLNLYRIEITNDTDDAVRYKLKFDNVQVTPASFSAVRNYNSYICDLYESVAGVPVAPYIPALSSNDAAGILKAMSEPVTNALSFFCGKQERFVEFLGENKNYDKTLLEQFGDDSVAPTNEYYKEFIESQKKTICNSRNIPIHFSQGDEDEEWVAIPQGGKASVYFAVYFDGETGTDGTYDGKSLLMQNSNGFMGQQVKMVIALAGGRFN